MRGTVILLAVGALATPAVAADISGRVVVRSPGNHMLQAGYAGVDLAGKPLHNMVGTDVGGAPSGASRMTARAWSTSFKPRNTGLEWDSSRGCTYQHLRVPAGVYVVYARMVSGGAGERVGLLSDWKLVRVASARAQQRVDLALSPSRCGALQVSAPGRTGLLGVRVSPTDPQGRELFRGSDDAFGLAVERDLGPRGALVTGLRAGSYRVRLRALHRQGTMQTGMTTTIDELGRYTVRVPAGRTVRYVIPRH